MICFFFPFISAPFCVVDTLVAVKVKQLCSAVLCLPAVVQLSRCCFCGALSAMRHAYRAERHCHQKVPFFLGHGLPVDNVALAGMLGAETTGVCRNSRLATTERLVDDTVKKQLHVHVFAVDMRQLEWLLFFSTTFFCIGRSI